MIDRNRSLIHTLMAVLVGLTLGLFIGWWVWPVQWIEAPGTAPAASELAESAQRPAVENEESNRNPTAFLDWVNQGLLYVAAALLLVGGVVIGYQLLRQSQGKDPPAQPFPLPFNRSRSNQATAPREPRAKPPPLAGRPARQRKPSLNWLHRDRESERPSASEEPVFREQTVTVPRPGEHGPHPPAADSDPSHRSVDHTETDLPSTQMEEVPSSEGMSELPAGASVAPPEQAVEGESRTDNPVSFGAPETAMKDSQSDEVGLEDERFAVELDEDSSQMAAADDESDDRGSAHPVGAAPTDTESEGIRISEERELWQDDRLELPSRAPRSDGLDEPEEETVASTEWQVLSESSADPEGPFEWEEKVTESSLTRLTREQESGTVDTRLTDSGRAPVDRATGQLVGQFEANYAFGIQTYDESFTINAADGELLGACGMGINESVDRAAANSDQVRLLDIWLYDRSAVRSVSQPLVSPGFDVLGLEDYAEGSGSASAHPKEVVPGLSCTLQSDRIVLECTIQSASFLDGEQAPMPFRSVSVNLAVYVQS